MNPEHRSPLKYIFVIAVVLAFLGISGYLGYANSALKKENMSLEKELADTKAEFTEQSKTLLENIEALKVILAANQSEKSVLEEDLRSERELVESIEAQVAEMTGTVGTLKKLSATDRELLKKYSRIYFLNENYIPPKLMPVPAPYVHEPQQEKLFSADALPFLENLLADAERAGMDIKVISAYRSFSTQAMLKSTYSVTYGSGSNKFSADQGYSEHQLGTTADFTTAKLGANFNAFEKTSTYLWLTENAYRYGFVLSYPKYNSYYVFEPWHWRFVGKALALKLHTEGKNFYDLTQREIDGYLVALFDQ